MKKLLFVSVFLLLTGFVFGQAVDSKVLKVGYVDADPAGTVKKAAPFAEFAGKALSSAGITSAQIVVAKDTAEMAALLKAGKVDLYIDTVHPVLEVSKATAVDLTWRRWKKGVSEYYTLFVTKKASELSDLKALNGLKIGFEDAGSTSGRWMPVALLLESGYKLADASSGGAVAASTLGFVFTGSADNTPLWLMQGKIDVGVISNNDFDEMQAGLKANLKVIGQTAPVPRQLIVARSDLPAPVKTALKAFFAGLDKSPEGQAMLKAWEKTGKVDEVTPAVLTAIKQFDARLK